MSQFNDGHTRSYLAGADLSEKQYYIVGLDTSNQNKVVLANAQTIPIIGVVDETGDGNGDRVRVRNVGTGLKVLCGGNISIGAYVTADSAGKAIATTTAGDMVIGRAIEAGADGQVIEIVPATPRY